MTEAEDISVGNRLATARKKKRLRYKKLSSELNIEESYLVALEEEKYDRIPGGEAYVKGFLRSYAKKLNLDPDEIISQYLLTRIQSQEGNAEKKLEKGIELLSIRKKILFLFSALLIIFIFIFFFLKEEADSTEIIIETYYSDYANQVISSNNAAIQETENIENPIEDAIPKINPIKEFFSVFPAAIMIIPIVAIKIDTQTFKEIFSFKNRKDNKAAKKGIAARHNNVTAALVFVIENIKVIIARPNPDPPIRPDIPIFK